MIIEDVVAVRRQLRDLIKSSRAAEVVGEVGSVAAAIFLVNVSPVDALVLSAQLWDGAGSSVLAEAKRVNPDCVVIMLTSAGDSRTRETPGELGVDHFLDKGSDLCRVPEILAGLDRPAPKTAV